MEDFAQYLDLRGTPCPANFVRCCLALENLALDKRLKVDIDKGEPELTVIPGLKEKGYQVEIIHKESNSISLLIFCDNRSK